VRIEYVLRSGTARSLTAGKSEEGDCIAFRRERGLNDSNINEKGIFWEAVVQVLVIEELSKILEFLEDTRILLPSNHFFLTLCQMNDDFPAFLPSFVSSRTYRIPLLPVTVKSNMTFAFGGSA
jgi:hypothetical protein